MGQTNLFPSIESKHPEPLTIPYKIEMPSKFRSDEEKTGFNYVDKSLPELKDRYKKEYGNIISPDFARDMFDKLGYDKLNHNSINLYSRPARQLVNSLTQDALEQNKNNPNKNVLVLAGGTGSGKTTVALSDKETNEYSIIFDTNILGNNSKNPQQKLQSYLDEGYNPTIKFIYRDPVEAYNEGILNRIHNGGHIVPVDKHLQFHKEARDNFITLEKHFGDKVNWEIKENNGNVWQ